MPLDIDLKANFKKKLSLLLAQKLSQGEISEEEKSMLEKLEISARIQVESPADVEICASLVETGLMEQVNMTNYVMSISFIQELAS